MLGRRDFLKLLGLTTGAILTAPVSELIAEVVPAIAPPVEPLSTMFFRINGRNIAPIVERLDVRHYREPINVTCAHDDFERFVPGLRRSAEIEADLRGFIPDAEKLMEEVGEPALIEFGDTAQGVAFSCQGFLERYRMELQDGEPVGQVRVRPTGPVTVKEA